MTTLGYKYTADQRARMSAANKGQIPWNKGRVGIWSDSDLIRMSEERSLPLEIAIRRRIFAQYRTGAIKRGLLWALTEEEVGQLIKENCFYCGSLPSNMYRNIRRKGKIIPMAWSGIDRIESRVVARAMMRRAQWAQKTSSVYVSAWPSSRGAFA